MRGKAVGNLVKHLDRAVVDAAGGFQQRGAALFGQLAPERQCTLGERNVRRVLIGEPEDARWSVRAAAVMTRGELLHHRDASSAHGESSRRRGSHRAAADNDYVVA